MRHLALFDELGVQKALADQQQRDLRLVDLGLDEWFELVAGL